MRQKFYRIKRLYVCLVPCYAFATASPCPGIEPSAHLDEFNSAMRFDFRVRQNIAVTQIEEFGLEQLKASWTQDQTTQPLRVIGVEFSGIEGIGGVRIGPGWGFIQINRGATEAPPTLLHFKSHFLYHNPILGYRYVTKDRRWRVGCHVGASWSESFGWNQYNFGLEGQTQYGVVRGNLYVGSGEVYESFRGANRLEVSGEVRWPSWPALACELEVGCVLTNPEACAIVYPKLSADRLDRLLHQLNLEPAQSRANGYVGVCWNPITVVRIALGLQMPSPAFRLKMTGSYRFDLPMWQQFTSKTHLRYAKSVAGSCLDFVEQRNMHLLVTERLSF